MAVLRAIWIVAAFGLLLVVAVPFQPVVAGAAPNLRRLLPMSVFRLAARIMGARISVSGRAPRAGPRLIAANHVSWIDVVAIGATVPCGFVAKSDVASWPVFGFLARLIGTVFVDRRRRGAVIASRKEMRDRFEAGEILVLFPEGTSSDGRRVLGFKSALFGCGDPASAAPVQPLTIGYRDASGRDGTFFGWYGDLELLPHMWRVFRSGGFEVTLVFHAELAPESARNRKELAARCEAIVREGLALTRKEAKETDRIGAN